MAKRGRKSLFKEELIEQAENLGAYGLICEEIADFLNVSRTTLYNWAKKHPEFLDAIKKGKQKADMSVVKALLKEAREGNLTGIIFWLKNRWPDKWRDKKEEISVNVNAQASAEAKANVFSGIKESDIRRIIKLAERLAPEDSPGGKNRIGSSQLR